MAFFVIDNGCAAILNYSPKVEEKIKALSKTPSLESVENEVHTFADPKRRPAIEAYQKKSKSQHQKVFCAKDIMQHPVITLEMADLSLQHTYETLQQNKITHIPICLNGKLVGIISETDILKAMLFDKYPSKQNWLVKKVYAATQETAIQQLTHAMFDTHIGAMPIINDQEEVIGIITRSDILKLTSHYGPMEFWA